MFAPDHGEFGESSRAIEGAPSVPIVIRKHARRWPDKPALIFLDGSGKETAHMTYGTLVARVERLASGLRARGLHGQPVGLAFPPGLEFVQAFLACLRAGVIAVPLALPGRRDRRSASMGDLLTGAGAPALLATRSGSTPLEPIEEIAGAAKLALLFVEDLDGNDAPIPAPDTADVAFLQYTSGSTRKPKGVMVTQRNLLAMERMIQEMFQHDETSTFVGWAPHFHDQGLVGNIIQPLFIGATCVLMAPSAFLARPLLWLEAIDRYRAKTSGGPNFAFEQCVIRQRRSGSFKGDLSCWVNAFNGAEPVRASTLEAFTETFAPFGFEYRTFMPCYGLAECTLVTLGDPPGPGRPHVTCCDRRALMAGSARLPTIGGESRAIVSCGKPPAGVDVAIVDDSTGRRLGPRAIGEIWIAGDHVAAGYWRVEAETAETFHNRLPGMERPYLRTGDLGFYDESGVYCVGRIKEIMIIRGHNYYPHDVEETCGQAAPELQPGAICSIEVEHEDRQYLAVIAELTRTARHDYDVIDIGNRLRRALLAELELNLTDLMLVPMGGVLKTSSGKLRRLDLRKQLLDGALHLIAGTGPLVARLRKQDLLPTAESAAGWERRGKDVVASAISEGECA